ncbi:hypothetical protein II906_08445 [bacterium]|nr:hypothetical protein [bacterium]
MLAEINSQIDTFIQDNFTGPIKFGIEHSKIVSITINSRQEFHESGNKDFNKKLIELCSSDDYFGSIEFDLELGEVKRLNYIKTINGASLIKRLGYAKV